MKPLDDFRVAALVTDGFEESELTRPVEALRNAGAEVHIVSPRRGPIQGFRHHDKVIQVQADHEIKNALIEQYDALLLPGGALNADALRMDPAVQNFVREMDHAGKPIGTICHAGWILVSAGLVSGRELTSYGSIRDDIKNAGGKWVDREVVVNGNWVTSRKPADIPAFNRELIKLCTVAMQNRIAESA